MENFNKVTICCEVKYERINEYYHVGRIQITDNAYTFLSSEVTATKFDTDSAKLIALLLSSQYTNMQFIVVDCFANSLYLYNNGTMTKKNTFESEII